MPNVQGSSRKAIEQNTQIEIREGGKDPKQAYAIANAIARRVRAKKSKEKKR